MSPQPRPFRLGCIHDTPHRLLTYAPALSKMGALFDSTPTMATGTISLAQYEDTVFDQGETNSCEGNRGAAGISIGLKAANDPLPWVPSQDGLYRDLRCMARLSTSIPLTDSGGMTSDFVSAASFCGVRKMGPPVQGRNCDVDPATVNDEPKLNELDAEAEAPVLIDTGAYRIDLTNTAVAIAVIQQCLHLGYPIALDVICDTAMQDWFQNWTPSSLPLDVCDPEDPSAGGHAVLQTGLRVTTANNGLIEVLNSWGNVGAPPLVSEGPNKAGHLIATFNWFKIAVVNALVLKCSRM